MRIGGNTNRRRCRQCMNQEASEKKQPRTVSSEDVANIRIRFAQDSFGACWRLPVKASSRDQKRLDLSPLSL